MKDYGRVLIAFWTPAFDHHLGGWGGGCHRGTRAEATDRGVSPRGLGEGGLGERGRKDSGSGAEGSTHEIERRGPWKPRGRERRRAGARLENQTGGEQSRGASPVVPVVARFKFS